MRVSNARLDELQSLPLTVEVLAVIADLQDARGEIRRRELNEYRWQCSGCRHFQKHAGSKYRCDACKREQYLSGSFKRDELEEWFDAQKSGES